MTTRTLSLRNIDLRALPIAAKIALSLSVILLITVVIADQLIRQVVREAQINTVLNDLEALSHTQSLHLADRLGQEISTLEILKDSATIRRSLEARAGQVPGPTFFQDFQVHQELITFRQTHPEFAALALLDRNGGLVAIDPVPEGTVPASSDLWDWYTAAYNNGSGRLYLSGPREDNLTGLFGTHIAVPIYTSAARTDVLGVLYGVCLLNHLEETVLLTGERGTTVLEPTGRVLISDAFPTGTVLSQITEKTQEPSGSFLYTDLTDQTWLYGYVKLSALGLENRTIADLGWVVTTRQRVDTTVSGAAQLANRLRVPLVVSLTLAILAITAVTAFSLRPLRQLTDTAAEIRAGNLDAPIPSLPPDEVGHLADTLREMVNRLVARVTRLSAAARVSRTMVLTLDISQLLNDTARAIHEQLNYPGVRIYLLDPAGREARLQAAAGRESFEVMRAGHRVPVDERSIIGRAILYGEPQYSGPTERMSFAGAKVRAPELALGLWSGGRAVGALVVIGEELGIFEQDDISVLTLIGDQLSGAIENARLFEQSTANLAEIEALNRRLTRQAWEEYLEEGGTLRRTRDPDQRWPATLETIRQIGEPRAETYVDTDGRSVLAVPLVLRGETIGTLAVTRPRGGRWNREEIMLVESIASRLTVIAEGIRLVEESTRRAEREQQVNEVSAVLLQRAASVDSVLQAALTQLSGALGSDHVSLRIGRPPLDDDRQITAGELSPASPDDGSGADRYPYDEETGYEEAYSEQPTDGDADGGLSDDQ